MGTITPRMDTMGMIRVDSISWSARRYPDKSNTPQINNSTGKTRVGLNPIAGLLKTGSTAGKLIDLIFKTVNGIRMAPIVNRIRPYEYSG